jgi:adenine phosphoribosyltransferase
MDTNNFNLDEAIRKIPDFPKPGVLFYDITSILTNPDAFQFCLHKMMDVYGKKEIGGIAAVEARGFLFAAPFAAEIGIPLVLIRKKGKLPGKTITASYSLEYGEAEIQLHVDDIENGKNYLLVDDLIATGGTLKAAARLIKEAGGEVTDIFGVVGLPFLNFDEVLEGYKITTLIDYHSE